MDKAEKLNKLLELLKQDTITPAEIQKFLELVLGVIKKSKDEFDKLSAENLKTISDKIASIEDYHSKVVKTLDSKTNAVQGQFERQIGEAKDLLKIIKAIKATPGKDGADGLPADEEKIVKEVMNKIVLPEYKETVLDGRFEIVEKINTGKKDDLKIEISQISGFGKTAENPKGALDRAISILDQRTQFLINKTGGGIGAGVSSLNALTGAVTISAGSNITLTPAGNNIEISSTGGGTPGGSNTQLQYNNAGAFGGITGATTNGTTMTLVSPIIATSLLMNSATAISWGSGDVTITHSTNALAFAGASSGYSFDAVIKPASNDGAALGAATSGEWSDLFLAEGGVINWDNGDVLMTQTGNVLAFAGASSGYTFDAVNVVGHTATLATGGITTNHEQFGTNAGTGSMVLGMFNATAGTQSQLQFYRSKNAAIGSATVVANGDGLGKITWYGAQQTGTFANQNPAAEIRAEVATAVTSGSGADMPGRLVFATTPNASGTLATRMVIDSTGYVRIGTDVTPSYPLSVQIAGATVSGNFTGLAEFRHASGGTGLGIVLGYNASTGAGIISSTVPNGNPNANFEFWTYNGSEWGARLFLLNTGKLGVGTTPSYDLDVNGMINTPGIEGKTYRWNVEVEDLDGEESGFVEINVAGSRKLLKIYDLGGPE